MFSAHLQLLSYNGEHCITLHLKKHWYIFKFSKLVMLMLSFSLQHYRSAYMAVNSEGSNTVLCWLYHCFPIGGVVNPNLSSLKLKLFESLLQVLLTCATNKKTVIDDNIQAGDTSLAVYVR